MELSEVGVEEEKDRIAERRVGAVEVLVSVLDEVEADEIDADPDPDPESELILVLLFRRVLLANRAPPARQDVDDDEDDRAAYA